MRIRTAATLAALLTAGLVPLAGPASAAPAKYADDFNGDGYHDLATAAPGATVGGKTDAGAVVVNYGSKSGIKASNRTVVTQNSAGVPGTAEKGDEFGSALAFGDLNRDGYADLVVGSQGEDGKAGSVTIVWGSRKGLTGGRIVADPARSSHTRFGMSLAIGDFTADGRADLAVGSTGADVQIFRGGFTKTAGAASRTWVVPSFRTGDSYGVRSLAAGDINGNGVDDLVVSGTIVGQSDEPFDGQVVYLGAVSRPRTQMTLQTDGRQPVVAGDVNGDGYDDVITASVQIHGSKVGPGEVIAYLGGPHGISPTPQTAITQDSPGVPGATRAQGTSSFGDSLAVGDADGDGYDDVAVGTPYETVTTASQTGTVTLLRGSAAGLTGVGSTRYTQNTPGIPDLNEDDDFFGSAVHLADLDGDGRADLAVGARHENGGQGAVWTLRGSATGPTTTGAVSFHATSVGVSGTSAQLGSLFRQ
ncbi:FG-GAP-like repeat-containing protein [Streptomyces sp. GbtcB6]|uniref:FG-GAP-like repeat-containing protein n=1 Tax=Streptomyces sp. GbtcB6 TaxID=2824751 RepID=UPI001C3095DD|nr:FG-GAP-like repeat-containing protein [Streptomyces sp. GbtcB6]